jgi:prepilin-type N-terminal cleavage/methylation domain-containing protein
MRSRSALTGPSQVTTDPCQEDSAPSERSEATPGIQRGSAPPMGMERSEHRPTEGRFSAKMDRRAAENASAESESRPRPRAERSEATPGIQRGSAPPMGMERSEHRPTEGRFSAKMARRAAENASAASESRPRPRAERSEATPGIQRGSAPLMTKSAFTMVELATAIAIIAIGLTAVVGVYLAGVKQAIAAKHAYTAAETARAVADDESVPAAGVLRNGYWVTRVTSSQLTAANAKTGLPALSVPIATVAVFESQGISDPLITMEFALHR